VRGGQRHRAAYRGTGHGRRHPGGTEAGLGGPAGYRLHRQSPDRVLLEKRTRPPPHILLGDKGGVGGRREIRSTGSEKGPRALHERDKLRPSDPRHLFPEIGPKSGLKTPPPSHPWPQSAAGPPWHHCATIKIRSNLDQIQHGPGPNSTNQAPKSSILLLFAVGPAPRTREVQRKEANPTAPRCPAAGAAAAGGQLLGLPGASCRSPSTAAPTRLSRPAGPEAPARICQPGKKGFSIDLQIGRRVEMA
jgi:hypothetical protein